MLTVNIHEAKTHLSSLLESAAKGEPFIIAKAGKPLVKFVPLDALEPVTLAGSGSWPGRSRCRMISTEWEVPRSNISSAANHEAAIGYAIAAVGGRAPRALAAARPQDDRGRAESADIQRDKYMGSRDQI